MEKVIIGIIIGLSLSYFNDVRKQNNNNKGVIIRVYKVNTPKQEKIKENGIIETITFKN